MDSEKQLLIGRTLGELKVVVGELGMPAFTANQIAKWLYQQHVTSIDEMTNISKVNREKLKALYEIGAMPPIDCQRSKDGTIKYLFPVRSGQFVETVFIPDGDRATLCVSCQVGCKMNCLFCQTGKQGFEGNLTAADILNQIYALPESDQLTNIVFMGQGEPMDNLDNVLRATQILTADYGWAWSPKRITVSSVGIKHKLQRFLDESECHVAISMHTPLPEQRQMLMPAERQMSITETVNLLRQYDFTHQRRCSFEYICFGGARSSDCCRVWSAGSTSSASTRSQVSTFPPATSDVWSRCATISPPTGCLPPSGPVVDRISSPPADSSPPLRRMVNKL